MTSSFIRMVTSSFICHIIRMVSMECYDSVSTFVSSPEFKNQEIEDFHILPFLEKSKSNRQKNECAFGSYRGSRPSPNPCWFAFRFLSIGIHSQVKFYSQKTYFFINFRYLFWGKSATTQNLFFATTGIGLIYRKGYISIRKTDSVSQIMRSGCQTVCQGRFNDFEDFMGRRPLPVRDRVVSIGDGPQL